jgi:hypothetical protein
MFLGVMGAVLFVAFKILLAIRLDLNVIKEIALHVNFRTNSSVNTPEIFAGQQKPTDGDFVFNTDEELANAEEIRRIKAETGMMSSEDEIELVKQMRQGGVTFKG